MNENSDQQQNWQTPGAYQQTAYPDQTNPTVPAYPVTPQTPTPAPAPNPAAETTAPYGTVPTQNYGTLLNYDYANYDYAAQGAYQPPAYQSTIPLPTAQTQPLPTPVSSPTAGGGKAASTRVKHPIRHWILDRIALVLTALLILSLVGWWLNAKDGAKSDSASSASSDQASSGAAPSSSTPEDAVSAYLSALENGNYADASNYESTSFTKDQKALLQNGIIPDSNNHIVHTSSSSLTKLNDTEYSTVVTYDIGTKTIGETDTITLQKSGDSWRIKNSLLGRIAVPAEAIATSSVGGHQIVDGSSSGTYASDSSDDDTRSLDTVLAPAYPGTYTLSIELADPTYATMEKNSQTISVSAGDIAMADVDIIPTETLRSQLEQTTTSHLQACVDNANNGGTEDPSCYVNAHCKDSDGMYTYTNCAFTVNVQPTVSFKDMKLKIGDDGALVGSFKDTSTVKVTYHSTASWGYETDEGYTATPDGDTSFSVKNGTISVTYKTDYNSSKSS